MDNKLTKRIVFTGIFTALIIVLLLSVSAFSFTSKSLICTLFAALIGHFFDKSKIAFCIFSCAIIVILMSAIQGIWMGVSVYIPMSILSVLFAYTFKLSKLKFYLISLPIVAIVSVFRVLTYTIFLNVSIRDYVFQRIEALNDRLTSNHLETPSTLIVVILIISYFAGITICQTFISIKVNSVFEKRIDPIMEKEIGEIWQG